MDDPGYLTMSAKELNRLEVLNRVLDHRLTQAQAAERRSPCAPRLVRRGSFIHPETIARSKGFRAVMNRIRMSQKSAIRSAGRAPT